MFAIRVSAGRISLAIASLIGIIRLPPRNPFAKDEVSPIGWSIVGRGRSHAPTYLSILQCSPRVVIRRDGHHRVATEEMRPGSGRHLDFVFGAAELLHTDRMSHNITLIPAHPRCIQFKNSI